MSQDASTRPRIFSPLPDVSTPPIEPFGSVVVESSRFPVESYSDRLRDDLFGDVERMLDSGVKLPSDGTPGDLPLPASKPPKRNGLADLVSPLVRRQPEDPLLDSDLELPLSPEEQEYDTMLANRPEMAERSLAPKSLIERVRESVRSYDRLLLGVGGVSIVVTLAVWGLSQMVNRSSAPVAVSPPPTGTSTTASQTDNQFIAYVQQALRAIDQQQPLSTGSLSAKSGLPNTNLPAVNVPGSPTVTTAPGTTTAPNSRPATGLSRLYVPVYQVPQTGLSPAAGPSVAPLPSANAPTTVRPPIPLSVPGVARTLVGVLELGDRSAALIEINGVAQRYRIGESISSSGWTLVEVSKDQAVIRRNGEV